MPSHLAHQFLTEHQDYFFQDGHYLVEAQAVLRSTEIAPNVFLFEDGSVLVIQKAVESVCTYPDELTLRKKNMSLWPLTCRAGGYTRTLRTLRIVLRCIRNTGIFCVGESQVSKELKWR